LYFFAIVSLEQEANLPNLFEQIVQREERRFELSTRHERLRIHHVSIGLRMTSRKTLFGTRPLASAA
jgi:hypothetical protein